MEWYQCTFLFIEVNGDVFLIFDLRIYKEDYIGAQIYGFINGSHNLLSQMHMYIWNVLASTNATFNTNDHKWSQSHSWYVYFHMNKVCGDVM